MFFCVSPFLGAGVESFEGCGGIDEFISEINYTKFNFFFIIPPPPEMLSVLGPWER